MSVEEETKKRLQFKKWYYYVTLIINSQKHYRLQRLFLLKEIIKNRLFRPARLKVNQ